MQTFQTGLGTLSNAVVFVGFDVVFWHVFGIRPSMFVRVGDMSIICSGVAVMGSTAGLFSPTLALCRSVSSGNCKSDSRPMVGFRILFS